MSLASHRIILGNALTLDIPNGHDAARGSDRERRDVEQHRHGRRRRGRIPPVRARPLLPRDREDSAFDWCPAGLLEVVNLANDAYEAILSELETVNALLANAGTVNSLVQYQVTTPDGTSVTRMTVRALHKHRADLEARKAAYERVYSGRLPVRFN